MAKRPAKKAKAKPVQPPLPGMLPPSPPGTIRVFPIQLHMGDRLIDATGEWEILGRPQTTAGGKNSHVRVQRVDKPGVTETRLWGSYEKVMVMRRATAGHVCPHLGAWLSQWRRPARERVGPRINHRPRVFRTLRGSEAEDTVRRSIEDGRGSRFAAGADVAEGGERTRSERAARPYVDTLLYSRPHASGPNPQS